MLKSVSIWALRENETRDADSLFAEAHDHGFAGIEPAFGLDGLVTPESTETDCRALVETAAAHGLRISSLASGLGWQFPLSADDLEVRRQGVELVGQSLQAAAWLGVGAVLVVPGMLAGLGGPAFEHVPYDVACDRMKESIAQLVPAAEELGVVIGIENVWNRVLLSPLEVRDFIDGFGSGAVGCYLDVGNMIVSGYAEDWIRILGTRVCSVHFKDFKRSIGTLDGFCDLLEGDVNYHAVVQSLRETGYVGPCVAEFFGLDAAGLAKLSAAMDEILAM
ncbi:MAG: sugar phosphate isomerase/epimerase family protein [Planctomycetota bacterium]|jgi:hexulose-6-phosphate isomerase